MIDSYQTILAPASHWSLILRRGTQLRITDLDGGANVGMLLYNPWLLSEKYNAPDTLKCQHTFKLTRGHCLYSDMGRIFCSIIDDSFGWHESVCGNSHSEDINSRWGQRNYQRDRNAWLQNGYDSFITELAKYELGERHLAANLNWFSQVVSKADGSLQLAASGHSGDSVTLRFEMDTLVILHNCPHPLNRAEQYPMTNIRLDISIAAALAPDDICMNHCPENRRGFMNNALYHLAPRDSAP